MILIVAVVYVELRIRHARTSSRVLYPAMYEMSCCNGLVTRDKSRVCHMSSFGLQRKWC
ncbi:hypothetical protein Ancab_033159, partial [Ancistrocladus abbreviatus]